MDEQAIRASEREAIKTLLTLDLVLLGTKDLDKFIERAVQLIDTRGENS